MDEKKTPLFDNDQHAYAAGRFIGLMMKAGLDVRPEMDGTDYTPVIKVDIEGQPPIWVRVLAPDL